MEKWEAYLSENRERFLEALMEFLRIPSVSSLPEHAKDVAKAAEWVARRLRAAGIADVEILSTPGHPVVFGQWLGAPGQPTALIYGHLDVQPADPLELWSRPPFDPAVENNRLYARGASDDKGNMLLPILAAEAFMKTSGKLPINVKFFFEGQEEIGSPDLPGLVAAERDRFACDVVLSADGGQWSETQPMLISGRRGLCALQIDVKGADRDVHSGTYGGTFLNPAHALADILSSLHAPDGSVSVEGFYEGVVEPEEKERKLFSEIPFDAAAYRREIGIPALFGEPGYTTYERAWIRPTLEINGLWGGFQGEGVKTIIPATAHAKITCRLVPDQDPADVLEKVSAHIRRHAPSEAIVDVVSMPGSAIPFRIDPDHPGNRAAAAVLTEIYGKAPYTGRMGGTIPVCGMFLQQLNAHTVGFSFGLKDENIHAPDEFFRLESFDRGQIAYGKIMQELAERK